MPEMKTLERAKADKRAGKAPSTQADHPKDRSFNTASGRCLSWFTTQRLTKQHLGAFPQVTGVVYAASMDSPESSGFASHHGLRMHFPI